MKMYLVLLRSIKRSQDVCIRKPHELLANTNIDGQHIYQEAIVECRSVSLVGERILCSNRYFEGSCSKISNSDCYAFFVAAKKNYSVYYDF